MSSSSSTQQRQFFFISLGSIPQLLSDTATEMHSKIFSGKSCYTNEMATKEAESILKSVKHTKK
jgi:hypothetical protein